MLTRLIRLLGWYAKYGRLAFLNWLAVRRGTLRGRVFFQQELQSLLGCSQSWLDSTAREYRQSINAWRRLSAYQSPSRKTDGFAKSLDVAEGFAVWALVKHQRPRVVVELGTQRGVSARLWKEALARYVPEHELILCDIEDARALIADHEATFVLGDARQTLRQVFETRRVDLLYNDAHPYDLIKWSVEEGLRRGVSIFVFHDVGRTHPRAVFRLESCNLSPEERSKHADDIARYGHWERHVMAEIFGRAIYQQDAVNDATSRIQIFDSLFGVGVAVRDDTLASEVSVGQA